MVYIDNVMLILQQMYRLRYGYTVIANAVRRYAKKVNQNEPMLALMLFHTTVCKRGMRCRICRQFTEPARDFKEVEPKLRTLLRMVADYVHELDRQTVWNV